ncbi:excinuclease ABC subunit B [Salipiger sp. P9]|uniref:excinuclease ABC subunit B n=1 Tax=Salipiger pentaromativorans TaxID=2943193 RepID=UPI0021580B14|nr:excinuclease ABC subunit B [Salipiger pentaromativorans]MCR8546374.1 excinuclease ABC subunit B [Salipiger pentaromativorans]
MRPLFAIPLLGLMLLAACATPQDRCLRDAAAPWRAALQERERIAKDLARGFTYETRFVRVTRFRWCSDGQGRMYPCWDDDMQPETRRIPVDAAALRARDAELARALPGLRRAAEADMAQCRLTYPETPVSDS